MSRDNLVRRKASTVGTISGSKSKNRAGLQASKSQHRDRFPSDSDLPLVSLERRHGTCGPKAVLGTLWYFQKRCGVKRLIQQCRMRRDGGSILAGLALALKRNGLSVTLYTVPYTSLCPRHRRIYEEAIRLQVPIRPALTFPELMSRIDAEHVSIVGYMLGWLCRPSDGFHISPLIGMAGRAVSLPYTVMNYTYTKREFESIWHYPGMHRQCLIVSDLPDPVSEPYRVPKWLQKAIARSRKPAAEKAGSRAPNR